jgi:hypothetical protein
VLEELRPQPAVDDELAVEVELGRHRRANGDGRQLTVALLALDVEGVLVLFPEMREALVLGEDLLELRGEVLRLEFLDAPLYRRQAKPVQHAWREEGDRKNEDQHGENAASGQDWGRSDRQDRLIVHLDKPSAWFVVAI